ncbi:MAG: C1 family peptidase [Saprospiraceae bacterium]|nr:C1 family peptidase [Saprospiraceae bacterium]
MYSSHPATYRLCLVFVLLTLVRLLLPAQGRATGLLFDDAGYLQLPEVALFNGSKADELPFKVDLSPYCPKAGDQGDIASCVGWASGYGALSILLAKQANTTDSTALQEIAQSALFVYNQIKTTDCAGGALLDKAGVFLQNTGNIPAREFDSNNEDCLKMPDTAQLRRAAQHRIRDAVRLFSPETPWYEKALKIKQSLAAGKPVVAGLEVTEGFLQLRDQSEYWDIRHLPAPAGGHALVVVGYSEARRAFRVLNSWGQDWGKNGYCWIKYEDFGQQCKYGIQFVPEDVQTTASRTRLQGRFVFRTPETTDQDSLYFQSAAVVKKGNYYETQKTDWSIGQLYQLVVSDMVKDRYVYVFSIDPVKKAQLHFPQSGKVITTSGTDPKPTAAQRSELVPDSKLELVIPEPLILADGSLDEQGLVKAQAGADQLYILYSLRRIDAQDLENRIRAMLLDDISLGFLQRFEAAFRDLLIPWADIRYDQADMHFTADSDKGYVVPIVLRIPGL